MTRYQDLISQQISKPVMADRDVFAKETLDLFAHRRQGHMIHRCYMTAKALEYGGKFQSTPENYLRRSELDLIQTYASHIGEQSRHFFGVIGIENGTGMENAMRAKTAPFFRAFAGLHTYYGRDMSQESVDLMKRVLPEEMPNVRIVAARSNYLMDPLPENLGKGRKVMAEFGMTRGNMEGFTADGFPYDIIKNDLLFHRAQMNEGDFYIFNFDANQNGDEVEASYNNIWTTLWARELLVSMKTYLDIDGDFDPEGFYFRCIWDKDSHGGHNHIVADRRMDFSIEGQDFTVHKGDMFGITNSYKMPVDYARLLAKDTGWTLSLLPHPEGRLNMAYLKAV